MSDQEISLNHDQRAVMERAEGGRVNVYIQDIKGQRNPAAVLDADHPTLTVTGRGGDKAVIEIPPSITLDANDFIPRLRLETEKPPLVQGTFIAARESRQEAKILAQAIPSGDMLSENNGQNMDARAEAGAQRLHYLNDKGNVQAVFIESGGKGVELAVAATGELKTLARLSGEKPLNDNKAALAEAGIAMSESERREKKPAPAAGGGHPAPGTMSLQDPAAVQRIISKTLKLVEGSNLDPVVLENARNAAKRLLGADGQVDKDATRKLHLAVDKLISQEPDNVHLRVIKKHLQTTKAFQLSLGKPGLDEKTRALATAAVHPSLTGLKPNHVSNETNVASNLGRGGNGEHSLA